MDREQVVDPGDDRPFVATDRIEVRKVTVKEGVHFRIRVDDVSEVVAISLLVWNPLENEHQAYPYEDVLELRAVYSEREYGVNAFLIGSNGGFDPSHFTPEAVAQAIMKGCKIELDNGGNELHVYLLFGAYVDMLGIEREEAEAYVEFRKR